MMKNKCKVCVTGGAGYIAACLIKKLLHKGYTVHATLRNLKDESKVGLLRSFENGDGARLVLFEADIYKAHQFEAAIHACDFVFHVATPKQYQEGSQHKNISEAAIDGVKRIAMSCIKSRTVKRLIYTASVVAASPLRDDGTGFKDFMDETCWTPLHLSSPYNNELHENYTHSKTLSEREILSYNHKSEMNGEGLMEVVSLACGLVGGDTLLSSTPLSVSMFTSQLKDLEMAFYSMRFLEELLGKIPIVHINDVCDAHIFCIENPSINGRFLVASSYVSTLDIANYYLQSYHDQFHVKQKYLDGPKRDIKWASTKLADKGFAYKYDMKMILDDCIICARRMGDL